MRAGKWIAIAVVGAALTTVLAVGPAVAEEPFGDRMPQMHMQDAHGPHGGGGSTNLVDHGGPILPHANLYAIWWGDPSAWPSDAKAGLEDLLTGFGNSAYLQVAAQYMRGAALSTTFAGSFPADTSTPAKPTTASIAAEIQKVVNANGATADPNGIYFVFTSTAPPRGGNYCAWHSGGTVNGVAIAEAFMPNITGMAGCDPGDQYDGTGYQQGTRAIANVTSHEAMEAITDKTPGGSTTAWIDGKGAEISDKCAWQFGGPVHIGNKDWQIQENWSNAASGCVQQ